MGRYTSSSETIFDYPAEVIYDFVTNPANWGRTYKGSGGAPVDHLTLPLKVGDMWTEYTDLPSGNKYLCEWTLITANRPREWVFQQVNKIGQAEDRTGGQDGIITIAYNFEPDAGQGMTLFTRTLTGNFPKGSGMPDDMFVMTGPAGIDRYHAAIMKELDKDHGKTRK